jgi:hypothetical protein
VVHEDGTIAVYKGLHKNSIFVQLGQSVYPQTNLGVLLEFNPGVYRADFLFFIGPTKKLILLPNNFFKITVLNMPI